jgi:hypothetical protein
VPILQGRLKLTPQVGRWQALLAALLLALPAAGHAYRAVVADAWLGFPLFSLLFVPGALLVAMPLRSALVALQGDALEVSIDATALRVGGRAEVGWRMGPGGAAIRSLQWSLVGEEQTDNNAPIDEDSHSQRHVFHRQVIVSVRDLRLIRDGKTRIDVPGSLMHTVDGPHNRILWTLEALGKTRLGNPVLLDAFKLNVGPADLPLSACGLGPDRDHFACTGDPGLGVRLLPDCAAFSPGEAVRGQVNWDLGPVTAARGLRLDLCWHTTDAGDPDEARLTVARFSPQARVGQAEFEFTLPMQPCSLQGRHFAIQWSLELTVEGLPRCSRGDLVIGPGGRPVLLPTPHKPSWIPGVLVLLAAGGAIYALFQVPVDEPRPLQGGAALLAALLPASQPPPEQPLEEPAIECARGIRTSLHQLTRHAAAPRAHDQPGPRTTFLLRPLAGNEPLWSEELQGNWRCLSPRTGARGYLLGGLQQRGAWLPLASVLYLPEDGSGALPSALDREDSLALAVLLSPAGRYLAFVGGPGHVDGLYVLDTQLDEVRNLGPAPAPPVRNELKTICGDEPLAWGGCWADSVLVLESEVLRIAAEDLLEVSYGKDGVAGRAKTRKVRRFNLAR